MDLIVWIVENLNSYEFTCRAGLSQHKQSDIAQTLNKKKPHSSGEDTDTETETATAEGWSIKMLTRLKRAWSRQTDKHLKAAPACCMRVLTEAT